MKKASIAPAIIGEMNSCYALEYARVEGKDWSGLEARLLYLLSNDFGAYMQSYHLLKMLCPDDQEAAAYLNGLFLRQVQWWNKQLEWARHNFNTACNGFQEV